MKREYTAPQVREEVFTANDYVATCTGSTWGVSCNASAANELEKTKDPTNPKNSGSNNYTDGQTHSSDHCGLATNQTIYYNGTTGGRDSVAYKMVEINVSGQGSLDCTVYTDSSYTEVANIGDVKPGDYIYWTTQNSVGTTWYHQGTVYGHTNRS